MKKEKVIESIINDAKNTAVGLKKLPYFLGLNAFLFFIVLVLIDLLVGGFLFYKYAYLTQKEQPKNNLEQIIFNEENYRQVLDVWQKREEAFSRLLESNIKNPFK